MSNFVNRPDLEKAVEEMHKIDVEVSHWQIKSNEYKVKIATEDKEIVLHEVMKQGLTNFVVLHIEDKATTYKKYSEAEDDGIAYLKE